MIIRFEIYRDKKKEYRWRMISSNGRIVGDSAEGYKRKATMLRMFRAFANDSVEFRWTDSTAK